MTAQATVTKAGKAYIVSGIRAGTGKPFSYLCRTKKLASHQAMMENFTNEEIMGKSKAGQ